jgi:hypothetical protein
VSDLLSFIGAPTVAPTPGVVSADGVAAPAAPIDAFAALLDEVLTQVAVVTSAMPPQTPGMPIAVPTDGVVAADPKAAPTATPESPELPAPAEPHDEVADAIAISIARVALGLPTPPPVAPVVHLFRGTATETTHTQVENAVADAPKGVAVGRTGEMPTLPAQAHATLPTPTGIARRFPAAPTPDAPTQIDPAPAPTQSAPTPEVAAAAVEAAPVETSPELSRAAIAVETPQLATITPIRARETPKAEAPTPTLAEPLPSVPTTEAAPKAEAPAPTHEAPTTHAPTPINDAPVAPDAPDTAPAPLAEAVAMPTLSGAAAPVQPAEHEHIHGIAQPMRAAIRTLPKDGKPNTISLTVRLDPPELGAVRVRVVAQGEKVHVTLHAESPEAQAALEHRRADVAEMLRRDGFNLDGFDVESRDNHNRRQDAAPEQRRTGAEQFVPEPEQSPAEDDNELRL